MNTYNPDPAERAKLKKKKKLRIALIVVGVLIVPAFLTCYIFGNIAWEFYHNF